jgi:transcriptional regulator with XRE-family HTH domain
MNERVRPGRPSTQPEVGPQGQVWLGSRLKELRLEAELTQEDVAKKVGIHRDSLKNIELNRANPSPKTLAKLADTLDVLLEELHHAPIHPLILAKRSRNARTIDGQQTRVTLSPHITPEETRAIIRDELRSIFSELIDAKLDERLDAKLRPLVEAIHRLDTGHT